MKWKEVACMLADAIVALKLGLIAKDSKLNIAMQAYVSKHKQDEEKLALKRLWELNGAKKQQ